MGHVRALTSEEPMKNEALLLAGWNLTAISKVVKYSKKVVRNCLGKNGTSQSKRSSFCGKPKVMPSFPQLIRSEVTMAKYLQESYVTSSISTCIVKLSLPYCVNIISLGTVKLVLHKY